MDTIGKSYSVRRKSGGHPVECWASEDRPTTLVSEDIGPKKKTIGLLSSYIALPNGV